MYIVHFFVLKITCKFSKSIFTFVIYLFYFHFKGDGDFPLSNDSDSDTEISEELKKDFVDEQTGESPSHQKCNKYTKPVQ